MTTAARIIGRTAADRIIDELTKPGPTLPSRRTVLVRTFSRDEIAELVNAIQGTILDDCADPIRIVISMLEARMQTDGDLTPYGTGHRGGAEGGHTITSYRSAINPGLVMIELDPFSDMSGQLHLRTITDRDLLADERWRQKLIAHAWEAADHPGVPPTILTDRLAPLIAGLSTAELALRPWATFLLRVMENLPRNAVATQAEAERLISNALPALGVFRDPALFEHRNLDVELGQNRHLAQLRDLKGRDREQEVLLKLIEAADFGEDAEARRRAARNYILSRTEENLVDGNYRDAWNLLSERKQDQTLAKTTYGEWSTSQGSLGRYLDPSGLNIDIQRLDSSTGEAFIMVTGMRWLKPNARCMQWSGLTWMKYEAGSWFYDPGYSTTPQRTAEWQPRLPELLGGRC